MSHNCPCDISKLMLYKFKSNLVGVQLHKTLGWELVFSACLEVVWRFKQRIFYIRSLRNKLIVACQEALKSIWTSINGIGCSHSNSNTTSEHAPQVERN